MAKAPGRTIRVKSCNAVRIDYGDFYDAFEEIIEDEGLAPKWLRPGLAFVFPQYSEYRQPDISDMYFTFTVRKLLEELARKESTTVLVENLAQLDEKTRELLRYMQAYQKTEKFAGKLTIKIE